MGDLGDPITTTDYTMCLYAGASSASVSLPAGSNWQTGSGGFKCNDPTGTGIPAGARKGMLKSGPAGRAKILVKGKGVHLPDTLVPALAPPVTVQLVNDDNGACYEAAYGPGDVVKNDSVTGQFKAKN